MGKYIGLRLAARRPFGLSTSPALVVQLGDAVVNAFPIRRSLPARPELDNTLWDDSTYLKLIQAPKKPAGISRLDFWEKKKKRFQVWNRHFLTFPENKNSLSFLCTQQSHIQNVNFINYKTSTFSRNTTHTNPLSKVFRKWE